MGISRRSRGCGLNVNKAVFLDRDGVLNQSVIKEGKPYPPASVDEVVISPDVLPALQALKQQNFQLIVVTNQPDVARGKTSVETVNAINDYLCTKLPLDAVKVCFHDDIDHCGCRKPKAGLLLEAAKEYNIDLSQSVMIGDRWKDIAAGVAASCKTIWLNQHYDEKSPTNYDLETKSLLQASQWIIETMTQTA